MNNQKFDTKLKIHEICEPKSSCLKDLPFIALLKNHSGQLQAEVMTTDDQRILSRLYLKENPKEEISLHYLCAKLNKLNLTRYLRNSRPLCVPFQSYCDEDIILPSRKDGEKIVRVLETIYNIKCKRRSQILNSHLLIQSIFVQQFGNSIPTSFESDSDWKKMSDIILKVIPIPEPILQQEDELIFGINVKNDADICGIIHPLEQLPIHYNQFALIKIDKKVIEPTFLAINLETPYFKFLFTKNKSIIPFKDLPIFCPSMDKQKEFLEKIRSIKTFIEKLKDNIITLDLFYTSYIHNLL